MVDEKNYSLRHHNTFGIDVRCTRYIEYSSVEELQHFLRHRPSDIPFLPIGQGSNLLFTKNYEGIVLHSGVKGITLMASNDDSFLIEAGSGEIWDDFVSYCVDHGFYGLENLSLIPGEVGASAVQNIGAYGVEAKDLIEAVAAIDVEYNRMVILDKKQCRYAYRSSRFKTDWKGKYIITHVLYRLRKTFKPNLEYGVLKSELEKRGCTSVTAKELRQLIIDVRRRKLPNPDEIGSAGSFFMNPIVSKDIFESLQVQYPEIPHYVIDENKYKIPAGWLIEQCGWKGRREGHVGVYDKQALVIVNYGGGTGVDIVRLSDKIRDDVKLKFGIEIKPEVIWI